MKRLVSGFSERFNVTCSARAMHNVLTQYASTVRRRISDELSGKLFSVNFDLALRFGNKKFGVIVQYMRDWK